MANGNSSGGGFRLWLTLMVILIILVGSFVLYLVIKIQYNKAQPNYQTIEEQQKELEILNDKLKLERSTHFWDTVKDIGKWAILALFVGFCIWMWVKLKLAKDSARLTIDQALEKTKPKAEMLYGGKVMWSAGTSLEKVIGRKMYLLVYQFSKKFPGVIHWSKCKMIAVDPDDWDCGRIETIEVGADWKEAIIHVLAELDIKGYSFEKDQSFTDLEFIKTLSEKKKVETQILDDLGVSSQPGG